MAIFVHAVLPGVTTDQYDALNAKLQATPDIFDGCVSHACTATDDGLEIFDVWETEQQMNTFGERMMPIAAAEGFPAVGAGPRVLAVHNYWVPGAGG
ncbi:hypothetical protein PV371_18935 [Streptomyces sp. TX20-6-3]|uniref:hypothetical protein n=1 Tax=Streptomyces sp. TX20-6-3 TaxID=3028705 RepID=UPI0029BE51EA|nr:hypothetical protein [Streptomyces sp. TX20-6-3]MDX2561723.1 hypothetical protein [Streptomyces sp. TX20-6-3]